MKLSHKLTVVFLTVAVLVWVAGYLTISVSRKTLEDHFLKSSKVLSEEMLHDVERDIYEKVEIFSEFLRSDVLHNTIAESNTAFETLPDIQSYIFNKDEEYKNAVKHELMPFMLSLMGNGLSRELKEKTKYYDDRYGHRTFSEVIVTNRYGANVAQTTLATDYLQSDELWWQTAKKEGMHIGKVDYDESADDYSLDIGLRITDSEGNFMGVMKFLLSVEYITSTLDSIHDYYQELSDHHVKLRLVTHDGALIYSSETGDDDVSRFIASADFQNLQQAGSYSMNNDGFISLYNHTKGYKDVKGLDWLLITQYSREEVFAPLARLKNDISTISLTISIIAVVIGIVVSSRVTRYVHKFRDAAVRIGGGKLDSLIDVASNDEIGELAVAFNKMSGNLKESHEWWKETFDSMSDAVSIHDIEGNIVKANASLGRLLGLPVQDIVGKKCHEVFHGTRALADSCPMKKCIMSKRSENLEDYHANLNRWLSVSTSPIFDNKDEMQLKYVIHVARDITEQKNVERTIKLQLKRLDVLNSIEKSVNSSTNLKDTLEHLVNQVTTKLGIDAATVLLYNSHSQILRYEIRKGFHSDALKYAKLKLGESYAGRAALEMCIVTVPDLAAERDWFLSSRNFLNEKFVSYMAVPLIVKGEIKGVMELYQRSSLGMDNEFLEFLETIANQAAIAIDNAALFDNLQRSRNELILAYDSAIMGWSRAMDLRDKETEGHSRRVTEMTVLIAEEMNMDDEAITHMRRGALLHDIGKMGIPDGILHKPGKLTDEEWNIMKLHPTHAYNMLQEIGFLQHALDIPRYHHEKWDGSGYPQGLVGEEIPLSARIFAVVDVWDALLSDRPYRSAWPDERVIDYIKSESGIHFDPRIVKIFLKLLKKYDWKLVRKKDGERFPTIRN